MRGGRRGHCSVPRSAPKCRRTLAIGSAVRRRAPQKAPHHIPRRKILFHVGSRRSPKASFPSDGASRFSEIGPEAYLLFFADA